MQRRWAVLFVVAGLLVLAPVTAAAQGRAFVRIGAISAVAADVDAEVVDTFRTALETAFRAFTTPVRRGRSVIIVNGSVTALEREHIGGQLRCRCDVSLIVVDPRRGGIRAMISGSATYSGLPPRSEAALRYMENEAIRIAAQRALERLSEYLVRFAAVTTPGPGGPRVSAAS